jgi:PKD repeat protein
MPSRRIREPLLVLAAALALSIPGGCKKDAATNPQTGPTAGFTATPRSGVRPLDVDFTDQSIPGSSGITSGQWTFGDGSTGAWPSTGHLYGAAGTYTVSLTVSTAAGSDTETKTNYVTVTNDAVFPPTAEFSGSPTGGVAPLTVQFTDASTPGSAPITARSWSFGDGANSAATNPSHVYSSAGTYTVALTVSGTSGSNTNTKTNYITVSSTAVPPTAQFSGTPTSGPAPLQVQFTDQSTAGSSPITSRSWTFGDGGTSTATNPSHSYASPGNYNVSLTVTTAVGPNTQTKNGYIQVCGPPAAEFTGAPTVGVAPLTVLFVNQSTGATSWSWAFGDGGTSTVQNPTHMYMTPGTYNVRLAAQNACGADSTTKTGYITVTDACGSPVYSVTQATWSNRADADTNGYFERARLTWTTGLNTGCSKSVFARIYSRPVGGATWTLVTSSPCYPVPGRAVNYSLFIEGLPKNCYDFRIAVFECGGTTEKAAREPAADADLRNQCFEP